MRLRDGTELWTTSSGTGPPLVLLHGGPGLWDYLEPLAALLDHAVTAIRFDQRGCGRSTGDGPFTIEEAVDDLEQLRAWYDVERWHVVGHSWGAELALRYAAAYPARTLTVGYVAGIGAGDGFRAGFATEFERRLGADAERFRELESKERTEAETRELTVLRWACDFSPTFDGRAAAREMWDRRAPGVEVNHRANRELWADRATVDLIGLAPAIDTPVTIVQGRDDPRPWRAVDLLAEALPRMQRHVIDGAGHSPWVERPAETVAAILVGLR